MIPKYLFEKNKIKDHQRAMKSRMEKLALKKAYSHEPVEQVVLEEANEGEKE